MAEATPPVVPPATAVVPPAAATVVEPVVKPAEAAPAANAEPKAEGSIIGGEPKGTKPTDGDYSFKLPEGMKVHPAFLADATPVLKELGLKPEQAQKLVDVYLKHDGRVAGEREQQWKEQGAKWAAEAKAHKDFGGAKWAETEASLKRAVSGFSSGAAFAKGLESMGLGNWPDAIAFLREVGLKMGEGSITPPHSPAAEQAKSDDARLRDRYPNSPQMFEGKG